MSRATHEVSQNDGTSGVTDNSTEMAHGEADLKLQQHEHNQYQVCNIPFEVVDNDELAAIETALFQAHCMASAYRSISALSTEIVSALPRKASQNPNVSHISSSQESEKSFVYTVVSALGTSQASSRAPNGLLSSTFASARSSAMGPQGSASVTLDDACSSQESVDMCSASSQLEDAKEMLFDDSLPPVLSISDESSTPVSEWKPPRAISRRMEVIAKNSTLMRESIVQGQRPGKAQDIEDLCGGSARISPDDGNSRSSTGQQAAEKSTVTLFRRKSGRGLSVTDFTASEWCEKQVEFSLNRGKPEKTPAMKAGSARHIELEKEVVTRVEIEIHTREDTWAVRLLNFISGARQLLSEGLTRELPVVGLVGVTWVVGIIDEIRLVQTEVGEQPLLVDTKTRRRRMPPSEPQKRNARLQLMSYKLLWDSMVQTGLPGDLFFRHFRLNPQQEFCGDVKAHAESFWDDCKVNCLQDLLTQFQKDVGSQIYPKSVETLLLRYEWQEDQSLLGEDEFHYEHEWLMDRWAWHSEFWSGERAATFVAEEEAWKCRFCSFASVCLPAQQSQSTAKDIKEDAPEEGATN